MTNSLLIIGKPHSGKTTFIAQLYTKLDSSNKFYKAVENLSPIVEAIKSLAAGDEVRATPTDKSTNIILPIQLGNEKIDINYPDYGGEQIDKIIENRDVDEKWDKLIKESDNWVLFIRTSNLTTSYDLSNKDIHPDSLENNNLGLEEYTISDQSAFIELLQILLYFKNQDSHFKNTSTKLTVVLSCWDEVNNNDLPKERLQKSLPLLSSFIESNWVKEKINFVGLSSLEFSLKESDNKIKYQSEGSENFGYVIKADGTKTEDIIQLISEAL